MGVSDGQNANQTTFNNSFMHRNADSNTTGKQDFQNTDGASGADVINVQREINSHNAFSGRPSGSAYNATPAWANNDVGVSTDHVKQRADLITQKFNLSTGHKHTGATGDAPPIGATGIDSPLMGFVAQGTDIVGATGGTHNVSSLLTTKNPSTGSAVQGVPSTAPYNKTFVRFTTSNDPVEDGSGNQVYGRLTNTGGVGGTWTLTFYSDVAGVETAYSFAGSNNISWWYQELFHPIDSSRPVYNEDFFVPSDNATQDVLDASATQSGKVNTGAQTFAGVKTFNSAPVFGVPLGQASGGTGFSTYTLGDILYASALNVLSKLGIGTVGQVLSVVAGAPAWADAAGGGGGGAPIFLPLSGNSMTAAVENNCEVYLAQSGLSQDLFAEVWVPESYSPGKQIKMYVPWYSPDVTGTALVQTVATLIRSGVDAASSTTNQRTSTNAAVNLATGPLIDKMQGAVVDLTSAIGEINGVAVAAGDNIIVQLLRGTDTATSDIRVKVKGVGVTFDG